MDDREDNGEDGSLPLWAIAMKKSSARSDALMGKWSTRLSKRYYSIFSSLHTLLLNKIKLLPRLFPASPKTNRTPRILACYAGKATLVVATLAGGIGVADYYMGRPWPTAPEIHPRDSLSSSSLIAPFTLRNNSMWPINDAEIICGIDLVYLEDSDSRTLLFQGAAFVVGKYSIQAYSRDATVNLNFDCDAKNLVNINDSGFVVIRKSMISGNSLFSVPVKTLKMCLWTEIRYTLMGRQLRFKSNIFQWPQSASNLQWLEGPYLQDKELSSAKDTRKPTSAYSTSRALVDVEGNLLDNALDCNRDVNYPFPLFRNAGPGVLEFP